MTKTGAVTQLHIVALFYDPNPDGELFLVEHAVDEAAGRRRWGCPSSAERLNGAGSPEAPQATIQRIAKERFGYEMTDADLARCHHVLDTLDIVHENVCYEPFIISVDDRTKFVPRQGVVAEWKTFAALAHFAERRYFPEAHLIFLNAANESIMTDTADMDEDSEEFSEND